MIKNKLISDLELRLGGGHISDDSNVNRLQLGHWLDIIRDRLAIQDIEKDVKSTGSFNSDYLYKDEDLVIQSEQLSSEVNPRYYVLLNKAPLTDLGLKVITTDGEPIERQSLWERDFNKHLTWAKPNINHLVYNRQGDRLYIDGVTHKTSTDYGVHAYYAVAYSSTPPDETEEFVLSDGLVSVLLDLVEETARKEFQTLPDLENDGNG